MPGAPTCQGRVLTEVGPGTKAKTKVQLIAELWPCRGSRGARALLRIRPLPLTGQSGDQMIYLPYGGTEAEARLPPIALNRFSKVLKRGGEGTGYARGAHMPRARAHRGGPWHQGKHKSTSNR